MANHLLEPLWDAGIRNTHFFNGRILDADALKTEQKANRRQHAQLGRALGEGVAYGLEVTVESKGSTTTSPVLKVRAGLAINRRGEAVELRIAEDPLECTAENKPPKPDTISLALIKTTDAPSADPGLFGLCTHEDPTLPALNGVYLLVLSPISGFSEHAPMKSLSVNGKDAGCGSRYVVEGVTFRLVGFPSEGETIGDLKTLQNRLAYRCYGVQEQMQGETGRPSFVQNPFAFAGDYGALDALRADGALTDCDVPLALLYQTPAGLQYCDMWAARRSLVPPSAPEVWPLHIGARRLTESQAMFLQFQDQLAELYKAESNRGSVKAQEHFRYLPPAGYLPVKNGDFQPGNFFSGLTTRRFTLDPAVLRLLVFSSWLLDPIDLTANTKPTVRLYESPAADGYLLFLREDNSQPVDVTPPPTGEPTPSPKENAEIEVVVTLVVDRSLREEELAEMISVTTKDKKGREIHGKPLSNGTTDIFRSERANTARFLLFKLASGEYVVAISASGYTPVTRRVTLAESEHKRISVKLKPEKRPGGKPDKPDNKFDGKWLDDKWYKEGVIFEKKFDWRKKEDIIRWKHQPDPPPDVLDKVREWGEWFQEQYPDAPIDVNEPVILIDPEYTPDQTPADFSAYLQFGEDGATVPLVLTAGDLTLDRPVSVGKGSLPGVDSEMVSQLKDAGVDDLSVLAAVPTSVLTETFGFSAETARGFVTSARGAVTSLQNSVMQFDGVTQDVQGQLAERGIRNATDMANADLATLTAAVGDAGFAARLSEQSRSALSREYWSLSAERFGLTEGEVGALHEKGVFTLGQVAAHKEAGTAGTLGLSDTLVDKLSEGFHNIGSIVTADRVENTPATTLSTVEAGSGKALAAGGFSSVKALAGATVGEIAAHIGGNTELAGRISAEAKDFQNRAGGIH